MAISNAEWDVMRVVWTQGETGSSQILRILNQKIEWKPSTIKTQLKRLVDKGYLATKKRGKGFVYSALIDEQEAINHQVDAVFDKFCPTKYPPILHHLLDKLELTQADVQDLQSLLASKATVDEIVCNCIPGQCHCKEHLERSLAHG